MFRTIFISVLLVQSMAGSDIIDIIDFFQEGFQQFKNISDTAIQNSTELFRMHYKIAQDTVENVLKQIKYNVDEMGEKLVNGTNELLKVAESGLEYGFRALVIHGMAEVQKLAELARIIFRGSDPRIKNVEDFSKYSINYLNIPKDVAEDTFLTTPELIKKCGYPSEIHTINTTDGYILEVHRIPNPGKIPAYLQHGLMDSSGLWVIMGPNNSLAYLLHDEGYDVWIGNSRGNRYSRKHHSYSPNDEKFWDFSYHEIGMYDVPNTIDYILDYTGYKQLHYVGHSQGTTAFWVMCSEKPEYNKKTLSMHALAPVAFLHNTKSGLLRRLADLLYLFGTPKIWQTEVMQNNYLLKLGEQMACSEQAITQEICINVIFLLTGYNTEQINKTRLPAILGHLPAGASAKQIAHFGQHIFSEDFTQFNYKDHNDLYYSTVHPPKYKLENVVVPVALYLAENDWLSDKKDVEKLKEQLPNVVKEYLVPDKKFNHLDYHIGMNSRKMVQEEVVKNIKEAEAEINII